MGFTKFTTPNLLLVCYKFHTSSFLLIEFHTSYLSLTFCFVEFTTYFDFWNRRCVLEPGDKIVDCHLTFTMYEFDAAVNGALVIKGKEPICFSELEVIWIKSFYNLVKIPGYIVQVTFCYIFDILVNIFLVICFLGYCASLISILF